MPLPRVRLRTLMIAVAVAGLAFAILVQKERHRRSRDTVFRFANAAAPVDFAQVTYSGGVVKIEPLKPGKVVEWRTHVSLPETMVVQLTRDGFSMLHSATPTGGVTVITFRPRDQLGAVSYRPGGRFSSIDVPVR